MSNIPCKHGHVDGVMHRPCKDCRIEYLEGELAALAAAPSAPEQPEHETIVREGDTLTCTACGTSRKMADPTKQEGLTYENAIVSVLNECRLSEAVGNFELAERIARALLASQPAIEHDNFISDMQAEARQAKFDDFVRANKESQPAGLVISRAEINKLMTEAGWQNTAIRQADLGKVEKIVRAVEAKVSKLTEPEIHRVYDFIGLHHSQSVDVLMTNLENMQRFSDLLDLVEREFFMAPGEPDEDFPDEDPVDECLLNRWGSTPEEYIEQFRQALPRIAAAPIAVQDDAVRDAAWLVESTASPIWWDGRFLSRGIDPRFFTEDANLAIRFARKEDAERVAQGSSGLKATEHIWIGTTKPSTAPVEAAPVLDAAAIQDGDGFCETCLSFGEINGGPCPDCAVKQGDAYRARQAAAAAPVLGESVDGPEFRKLVTAVRHCVPLTLDDRLQRLVAHIQAWHAAGIAEAEKSHHDTLQQGLEWQRRAVAAEAQQAAQGQDGAVAAWWAVDTDEGVQFHPSEDQALRYGENPVPYYTRPQPQVVAMTDEQIEQIMETMNWSLDQQEVDDMLRFARAIIKAAEGEKP